MLPNIETKLYYAATDAKYTYSIDKVQSVLGLHFIAVFTRNQIYLHANT